MGKCHSEFSPEYLIWYWILKQVQDDKGKCPRMTGVNILDDRYFEICHSEFSSESPFLHLPTNWPPLKSVRLLYL